MCFGPAPRDAALRRVFGDHRRAWAAARIFHEEAGNSVLLVDMNIEVALADARRIEALAKGFIRGCAARSGRPAFVRLDVVDEWLRSVDAAIVAVGGSRFAGADCKSHARLLCTPAYAADHPDGASDYIRKTCIIGVGASSSLKVLGVHTRSEDVCSADMDKLTLTVAPARAAVEGLQDPAVELTR
ncbi:hypothetical protein AK812_SmicGene728 [Symbiodinium microadriaticum]|uniref:Uncharacterized protein n=1 Tax=Symbiodinium microadriaticum TaxID=2951 RepID=A0A1Q9F644_SYMMI|nr:hypothetical protein AK812_SmicGene728 [Symbiodinium microadriaticum]